MPATESTRGERRPFRILTSALDDKGIDKKKKNQQKKYAEDYDANSDLADRGFVVKQTLCENQTGNVRATAENCVHPRPYTPTPFVYKSYELPSSVQCDHGTGACFRRRGVNILEIGWQRSG